MNSLVKECVDVTRELVHPLGMGDALKVMARRIERLSSPSLFCTLLIFGTPPHPFSSSYVTCLHRFSHLFYQPFHRESLSCNLILSPHLISRHPHSKMLFTPHPHLISSSLTSPSFYFTSHSHSHLNPSFLDLSVCGV